MFTGQGFWIELDSKGTELWFRWNCAITDICSIFYIKLFGVYYGLPYPICLWAVLSLSVLVGFRNWCVIYKSRIVCFTIELNYTSINYCLIYQKNNAYRACLFRGYIRWYSIRLWIRTEWFINYLSVRILYFSANTQFSVTCNVVVDSGNPH